MYVRDFDKKDIYYKKKKNNNNMFELKTQI